MKKTIAFLLAFCILFTGLFWGTRKFSTESVLLQAARLGDDFRNPLGYVDSMITFIGEDLQYMSSVFTDYTPIPESDNLIVVLSGFFVVVGEFFRNMARLNVGLVYLGCDLLNSAVYMINLSLDVYNIIAVICNFRVIEYRLPMPSELVPIHYQEQTWTLPEYN